MSGLKSFPPTLPQIQGKSAIVATFASHTSLCGGCDGWQSHQGGGAQLVPGGLPMAQTPLLAGDSTRRVWVLLPAPGRLLWVLDVPWWSRGPLVTLPQHSELVRVTPEPHRAGLHPPQAALL